MAAAAVTSNNTLYKCLPDNSSIYSAELTAILLALSHIQSNPNTNYIILSDSQSALKAIDSRNLDHPHILSIYQSIHPFNTKVDIIFCWVPSHVGIPGNELADQAAKEALNLPDSPDSIIHSDLRPVINKYIFTKWQDEWNQHSQSLLYPIIPITAKTSSATHQQLSRREKTVINRLKIGHTNITHAHLLKCEDAPICIPCQLPLTVKHILIDCIDCSTQRQKYYQARSLPELFSNTKHTYIVQFLKDIVIYYKI